MSRQSIENFKERKIKILNDWPYAHSGTWGTCDDTSCSMHGYCHCQCGGKTSLSLNYIRGKTYGMPHIWKAGHCITKTTHYNPGARGVPAEKVRLLLRYLYKYYGSWNMVSFYTGMNINTIYNIMFHTRKVVFRSTATPIVEHVLRIRNDMIGDKSNFLGQFK